MEKNLGKKINVNAASLVDLKAELFKRKEQFKREKGGKGSTFSPKPVSEKTASIWLKQKSTSKVTKSKPDTKDTKAVSLTEEEEKQLARSRATLEAKAALYEKLTKKENLPEEDEDNPYLVDFQQKYIDKALKHHEADGAVTNTEKNVEVDDDWVEYTDAFGRSRKCLRKDLPELEENDNHLMSKKERSPTLDLMSDDMKREIERQRWEEDAYEELSEETGPVHYQDVQHNEIRSHGVAYYQFATDEEKRQAQLTALNKLRDQTIEQRQKREKLKEKRKSIAEARLRKIKARKLGLSEEELVALEEANKELPQETKEETNRKDQEVQEVAAKVEEIEATMKRAKHQRPWDRGKIVDPIKKQKKQLEDERLPEFAPPASYYKSEKAAPTKQFKNATASYTTIHSDLAYNSVNAESSHTVNAPSYQLPPLFSHPTFSKSSGDPITEISSRNVAGYNSNSTEDNESDPRNTAVQKPDDIRESVTEVLRYYKSKYTAHN